MTVECCLFDMGNVLVRFSHDRMCRQLAMVFETTPAAVRAALFDSGLQWKFERGEFSPDELAQRLNSHFNTQIPRAEMEHAGSDIFEPNDDIESVIAAIHRNGIPLVLLSNTSISHFQFVQSQFNILTYFQSFVLSYEVGALKPSARIFAAAARQIGCQPAHCFYTDDIAEYVAAGCEHGFDAELFINVASLKQQLLLRGVSLSDGQTAASGNTTSVDTPEVAMQPEVACESSSGSVVTPDKTADSRAGSRPLRKPA